MRRNTIIRQSTQPSLPVRIGLTLTLLLIAACGGLIFVKAMRGISEARESGSWPTVAGRIIRSEMDVETKDDPISRRKRSDSKFYAASIEYEFELNGTLHRGSRIAAIQDMNADKAHVQKILDKYPVDRAVAVSYKPDDPGVSVLEPGSWGGVAVFFGLAAVFTLVPLGILIVVWRTGRKSTTPQSSVIRDSKSHSARTRFCISALLLVFIGIGCIPLTWAVQGMREAGASLTWPTVPGKITKSQVGVTTTRNRQSTNYDRVSRDYSAEIEYEFEAEGATYHGSRVAVVSDQFGGEAFARETCEKYQLNQAVTVSYKPGDPSECLLEPGRWGGIGFQLAFAGAFIFVPLLLLKAMWTPDTKADPERSRFGLVFRERFLEWEPGNVIHLHRDRAGFLVVVIGAVIGGLAIGLIISLLPAVGLLAFRDSLPKFITQHGIWFIANFYAAVSLVSAIGILIWALFDGRGRDTQIDWNRGSFRGRVGWSTRECELEQIHSLTLKLPQPSAPSKNSNASAGHEAKYAAKLIINVAGRKYVLLESEFEGPHRKIVRRILIPVIEELSEKLKKPWNEA
ncbi:MAG: DUF3592 domain-containing protein [Planctomycetota bacterium]|nr:DUF3592 domain-containing protein [Planctomycetota bacterium]